MSTDNKTEHTGADGMAAYEFLVDHIGDDNAVITKAVDQVISSDTSGQFSASAARFLSAVNPQGFAPEIDALLKSAIDKDREKQYLPTLLPAIWGQDYMVRAEELRDHDDNFRRIFKRVHPAGII